MTKFKSKTKCLAAITAAMLLCTGVLIAIPMNGERGNVNTRWATRASHCPPGEVPICPMPCEHNNTPEPFLAHPGCCSHFFQCSNGVAYCWECPPNLHFNPKQETCQYPEEAGCCPRIGICMIIFRIGRDQAASVHSAAVAKCPGGGHSPLANCPCWAAANADFSERVRELYSQLARCLNP